jgi:hypothetical protein
LKRVAVQDLDRTCFDPEPLMSSSTNGRPGGPHEPLRRLRYDGISTITESTPARRPRRGGASVGASGIPWLERNNSGRRFVILAVITVLVVWGTLYLVFREWRARYRVRAAYGANQVAPAIDVFAAFVPPGVDSARWRDAVARTHAMLVTITASNLLGLPEMRNLRAELDRAADRAKACPSTAVSELAGVWDDMSERGEFLLRDTRSLKVDRHPRPEILPTYGADRVAPALDPLAELQPPGVDAAPWRDAVDRTRALVLDVTASRRISTLRMKDLRRNLDQAVAHAQAHPESAVRDLAVVWESFAPSGRAVPSDREAAIDRHVRPSIFVP